MCSLAWVASISTLCLYSGQFGELEGWIPSQFTHFGIFSQSFVLCPSWLQLAQESTVLRHRFLVWPSLLHLLHFMGLGMKTSTFTFSQSVILTFLGSDLFSNVRIYLGVLTSSPLNLLFILSTWLTPWVSNCSLISSSEQLSSPLQKIVPLTEFIVLCFWMVIGLSARVFNDISLFSWFSEQTSISSEFLLRVEIFRASPIFSLNSLFVAITFSPVFISMPGNTMTWYLLKDEGLLNISSNPTVLLLDVGCLLGLFVFFWLELDEVSAAAEVFICELPIERSGRGLQGNDASSDRPGKSIEISIRIRDINLSKHSPRHHGRQLGKVWHEHLAPPRVIWGEGLSSQ